MSTEFNQKFKDDPLSFMRKYAVNAGDDIGNTGVKMLKIGGRPDEYFFRNMHETRRVGYLDFNKNPRSAGLASMSGVVKISGNFTADVNRVKSYYLPWATNNIIRLNIPALGTGGANDDVKYFFTAAISGCSVFVKGDPKAPIILHAGGNTHSEDPAVSAKFWRDMTEEHALMQGGGQEINKTHYVSDRLGDKSTAHSREFEAWLKASATGDLQIESTAATGCVMGIRDLRGDWSFYLQENITIFHARFRKILGIKTSKTVKGSNTTSVRPMIFRKFYPGGLGHAAFVPQLPRKL